MPSEYVEYNTTLQFYNDFNRQLGIKGHNFDTDELQMLLVTSDYTFDPAHAVLDDVTNEVEGPGYERAVLTNVTYSQVGNAAILNFDNAEFLASGGDWSARRLIVINNSAPDKNLICSGLLREADADVTVMDGQKIVYIVPDIGFLAVGQLESP